jgi:hypothetical protein
MSVNQTKINFTKNLITLSVVKSLAVLKNLSVEEAYIQFMQTKTYQLLQIDKSWLWTESSDYVFDMLLSELNHDTEEWLKI